MYFNSTAQWTNIFQYIILYTGLIIIEYTVEAI